LAVGRAGGIRAIIDSAPDGFFYPTGGGYTWGFLVGWVVIHYFVVGAEWAFVQRYISVSSPQNARKGAYLFGVLYLLSPFLWLAPPLAYRTIQPLPSEGLSPAMIAELTPHDYERLPRNVARALQTGEISLLTDQEVAILRDKSIGTIGERAYSRVCMAVLPIGMMGMMLAAMFSATASTVSGNLNVFAGVLTHDIYGNWLRCRGRIVGDSHLVRAGRIFTLGLGAVIVALALAVPRLGGAERLIVSVTTFMTVPLLAPVLAGLLSRRISAPAVWVTALASACAALVLKFVLVPGGILAGTPSMRRVLQWTTEHERTAEMLFAVWLPVATLMAVHMLRNGISPGSERVRKLSPLQRPVGDPDTDRQMASIVAWSLAACSVVVGLLIVANDQHRGILASFSATLAVLAAIVFRSTASARPSRQEASHVEA
jgi:Na+/proline symporter